MTLNISSDQLANNLLVNLLKKLSDTFSAINCNFFVIGATARDIILQLLAGTSTRRKTRDLDIAIAVPHWQRYNEICKTLSDAGFAMSTHNAHRFHFGEYEVDVLPYGAIAKDDGNIYWPPEETTAMSVKGFAQILDNPVNVIIDKSLEIKVVSLQGLFILKLNAWLDRNIHSNKDAEDIWYIIDNYYFANENRQFHQEVYNMVDFDLVKAGAYWMAHDICSMLPREQLLYYRDVLKNEYDKNEDSRLITQIIETDKVVSLADVTNALKTVLTVFDAFLLRDFIPE